MNKIASIVLIAAIVIVGGYFILKSGDGLPEIGLPDGGDVMMEKAVVTYTVDGYSPSPVTVAVGKTVTFKNGSAEAMWTASAMHPTHDVYGGTTLEEHCPDVTGDAFDACTGVQPGGEWQFTFMKAGTWNYHNHLNPSYFGAVVVTAE